MRARALRELGTALLAACAGFVPAAALAQTDLAQQRARIAAQRAQAAVVLADRERACLPQFVVAPCREAARNEQQATLKRLKNEEMALDEAQRNQSAARRRESLAAKAAERQERSATADAGAAQRARLDAASPGAEPPVPASKERGSRRMAGPPAQVEDAGRRAALEAQNVAAFESRARAAQAHREVVALRNARRMQGGQGANAVKRSAPLPMPVFPAAVVPAPVAASPPAR